MSKAAAIPQQSFQRVLGTYDLGQAGPTFLALGGIHGNERAGVLALQRVLEQLQRKKVALRGRLIALAGNLPALEKNRRYMHRDLNRQWLPERIQALRQKPPLEDWLEDHEQRELVAQFENAIEESQGELIFMDLHTSSGGGPPFVCLGDTRPNRKIARKIPAPMVLGLEECIDGAVLDYFNQQGLVCIGAEGGQHDDPHTVHNLEAATWLAMHGARMLPRKVDLAPFRETLRRATLTLPRAVEVRYRHVLGLQEGFVMESGFRSFDPVEKGQLLAHDRHGELRAHEDGRILLPLYQEQGLDGYFLVRAVHLFWLKVASAFRILKLDRFVRWLPGVSRHESDEHSIVVDPNVARWYTVQIFHLLGFRKRRPEEGRLVFTRRWTKRAGRRLRA